MTNEQQRLLSKMKKLIREGKKDLLVEVIDLIKMI